jgi:hypothetical protein
MNKTSKTYCFGEPGLKNTESVIQAVSEKIDETGIKTVIVASSTGKTAIQFAETCEYEDYLPLHEAGKDLIRNTYYTLGQGVKVCVEVVLIAVDKGTISAGQDVIAVGGTGGGSDSAAIIKATSTADMFSSDTEKRLEIREIFAMPMKKKWWK